MIGKAAVMSRRYVRPGDVVALTATLRDSYYDLSWARPIDDGGLAVTDYQVTTFNSAGTQVQQFLTGGATTATVSGLQNGNYTSQVAARNAAGFGSPVTVSARVAAQLLSGTTVGFSSPVSGLGDEQSRLSMGPTFMSNATAVRYEIRTLNATGFQNVQVYVVPVAGSVDLFINNEFYARFNFAGGVTPTLSQYDVLKFYFLPSSADARLTVTAYR